MPKENVDLVSEDGDNTPSDEQERERGDDAQPETDTSVAPVDAQTNGGPDEDHATGDSSEASGESQDGEQNKKKRPRDDFEAVNEDADEDADEDVGDIPATAAVANDDDDNDDDNDDEEGGDAEEYQVERIIKHKKSAGGILYYIKWHGYPDSENTWEPEENLLPHCRDALKQYFDQNGGEDKVKSGLKKAKSAASSKRSTPADAEPPAKRQKADEPAKTWTPKSHDWTPDVEKIELIERDETGQLQVYIRFTRNRAAKVSIDTVKKHCPVPMLDFFQAHLKFKMDNGEDAEDEEGVDDD